MEVQLFSFSKENSQANSKNSYKGPRAVDGIRTELLAIKNYCLQPNYEWPWPLTIKLLFSIIYGVIASSKFNAKQFIEKIMSENDRQNFL